MSTFKNPSFTSYEHWPEHNDDPADVKKGHKLLTAQVAKTPKGRAMQWFAEEHVLDFDETAGQDPESTLIAKQEAEIQSVKRQMEKAKKKSNGEYLVKRAKSLLKFNKTILNQIADEADRLNSSDVGKARRLIARLEGLRLPAIINREKEFQVVADTNRERKEQFEAINSVLNQLNQIIGTVNKEREAANEEKEKVEGFAKQAIAELKNVKRALKAINEILSKPRRERMPNWYQVVQGWNRDMLQANTYLLSLFTRARATNPDLIMKAYPRIIRQASDLRQDYLNAAPAFAATHNHFKFSEKVMEDARQHKSPLARAMDGVMANKRPEEDDIIAFHTQVTRLPRKKVESLMTATRGTIKGVIKTLGSTVQEPKKKEEKAVA